MTALLTEHLPLLAGSPKGIKKLRELILELAVRGKLVPQDPNDEPASEFVKRIRAKKHLYLAGAKARKQKDIATDFLPEPPFGLPDSWVWQTVDDVLHVTGGVTLGRKVNGRKLCFKPYLRVANVQRGRLELEQVKEIEVPEDEVEKYLLQGGDLLITEGGDWDKVGRTAIWRDELPECLHQNHVFRARSMVVDWEPRWAEMYLNSTSARQYFAGSSKQTTNLASINMTQLRACAFPLPPLAEQHRIVAKVDELMALCDRLEARQADADSAHVQLVQALLDSLTQARDAEDFAQSWQCLAEHFHTLFITESSIDALKQALLRLAADGRLVSSNVPADYLSLSDVIEGDSLNGSSKKPQDSPGAVEILRISAGTGVSDFLTDEYDHKWADVTEPEIKKFLLTKGDLLACRFNGNLHYVGAFSLYCGNRGVAQIFPDKLIRFRADRNKVLPHYLKYILNAAPVRVQIESFCATTVGNIGISAKNLKMIKLRLPTLEEQSAIVGVLDHFMTLCEELKTRLSQACQLNEQLATTLVEQAIA